MFNCNSSGTTLSQILFGIELIFIGCIIVSIKKMIGRIMEKSNKEHFDMILLSMCGLHLILTVYCLIFSFSFLVDTADNLIKLNFMSVVCGCLLFQYLMRTQKEALKYFKRYCIIILALDSFILVAAILILLFTEDSPKCNNFLSTLVAIISFTIASATALYLLYAFLYDKVSTHSNKFMLFKNEEHHMDLLMIKQFSNIQKMQRYLLYILGFWIASWIIEIFALLFSNDFQQSQTKAGLSSADTAIQDAFDYSGACVLISRLDSVGKAIICFFVFLVKDLLPSLAVTLSISLKPETNSSNAFIEMMYFN